MAEILIWLLLMFLGFAMPMNSEPPPAPIQPTVTPSEVGDTFRVPHVIETVDALLLESYPVQIHLQVTGYQPDGCEFPVLVEQRRDGNHVTVEIYREMSPAVSCPMMIVGYEETIPLEGGFESGTYTITVNGVSIDVTI